MLDFAGVTHVVRCPNGSVTLVGAVPVRTAYKRLDGTPLTDSDVRTIAICGPGFGNKYRAKTYPTYDDATNAIRLAGGTMCTAAECACRKIETEDAERINALVIATEVRRNA